MNLLLRKQLLVLSLVYFLFVFNTGAFSDVNSSQRGFNSIKFIGCWSSNQEYLAESYFTHHNDILDSDFNGFLATVFTSNDLCKGDIDIATTLRLSNLKRQLKGDGSHRHLRSTFSFTVESDTPSRFNGQLCEAVIMERLPKGVFADPFELQHLVHRKVFLNAAVFGDTNLELPSALSNRSIVEIHTNIGYNSQLETYEIALELPLHARYAPLDTSGYQQVEFDNPDLFLRCKRSDANPPFWKVTQLTAESATVVWKIPSGNPQHRQFVASVTFGSALVCSMLIVVYAVYFSGKYELKED